MDRDRNESEIVSNEFPFPASASFPILILDASSAPILISFLFTNRASDARPVESSQDLG